MPNDFFQINDIIKIELPGPDNNDEEELLAKIVKEHIIYRVYGSHDDNAFSITTPKDRNSRDLKLYGKRFLKPYESETIANENDYCLYKKTKDVSKPMAKNGELALDNNRVGFYNPTFSASTTAL